MLKIPKWRLYYHTLLARNLKFIIPENKKILFYGSYNGKLLKELRPSKAVCIEEDQEALKFAKKHNVNNKYQWLNIKYDDYLPKTQFDFIILSGTVGKSYDIPKLLKNLHIACHENTRIIIYQHNHLWQSILSFLEKIKIKRAEGIQNWLSVGDVETYLNASGFEVTRILRKTISPAYLGGIGPLVNFMVTWIPFIDFLKLDQFIFARAKPEIIKNYNYHKSLTICLTVRDEKDNIELIVKSLPKITEKQEILFVEGHSTDGTRKEIERVMKKYPDKKIKVMGQPGKGQGDAIRVGFKEAAGDVVILYEGDGTSDASDIQYFYEAMATGRFEFIEGSRFVYPLDRETMPMPNMIGNILFAKWFSFFLGQRITDVLSGIKAINKKQYEMLYERWGFLGVNDPFGDFELLYGAARMGLKFGEIPMHYYPRVYGHSKSKVVKHGLYLANMALKGYKIFRSNKV